MTYYGGAPDECSYCYVWGDEIVRIDAAGNCPRNHTLFGPAGHFGVER